MDIISYILSRKYTDMSIVGLGALKGANCTVKDIVHQDGINTVTFEWEGTDGTKKTRDMVVYDGTPIYVWESGNTYHYGDLAIYESQFYRCIVENHDTDFDNTKWNEIGSPDGNYDLVQSKSLLPARFTSADRKLYFVIDESVFYLWNGVEWVAQNNLVQVNIFPTADAQYVGKMYQYIGATNATYTHGFIYECVEDGGAYLWQVYSAPIIRGAGTNSVIEGDIQYNTANGNYAHAEGKGTQAKAHYSHSEGFNTIVGTSGTGGHAEGIGTSATSSDAPHAEGYYAVASGKSSHAQNRGTIAHGFSQTVIGKYNVEQGDTASSQPTDQAFILGNGEDANNRSNALAVQWDGTVIMQDGSTIKSAKTVYEVMGDMGAKNLLVYPYSDKGKTTNGITYTPNSDGSVTANGTSTDWTSFYLERDFVIKAGKYILSANTLPNGVYVQIKDQNTSEVYTLTDTVHFVEISSNEDLMVSTTLQTKPNITLDNFVFYPMLRYADDQDDTWQPYSMTNKELTNKTKSLQTQVNVRLEEISVLPIASATYLNKRYLYVGATDANYTKGGIYECQEVTPSTSPTTYHWVRISAERQIQADWTQTDSNEVDYIKNKPTLGTASAKNYTSNVRPNNTDLVESHAVYSAINNALSSIYVPRGELSCAELTTDLLIPANVGNVYTMSDSGTTSALFINGAGHPIAVNDNVGIIRAGADSIMFNLMGNAFDLHDYQTKKLETPITIDGSNETTVEGAIETLNDKKMSYEVNGILGAKNLIPYPYWELSSERAGISWSVDEDGVITANGTSTGYGHIDLSSGGEKQIHLQAGTYILSRTADDLNDNVKMICRFFGYNGESDKVLGYCNSGLYPLTFTITNEDVEKQNRGDYIFNLRAFINGGNVEVTNYKIHPMIRLVSDTDDTWQPYAMTNKQLTNNVQSLNNIPIAKGTGNNSVIVNDSRNIASGNNAVALGIYTQAIGDGSMAEGNYSIANGSYSHAEGNSVVNGHLGHGQNEGTRVQGRAQTAIGKYNIIQGDAGSSVATDQALIIGNGTDNEHRSNALAVQWDGTVVFQDDSTMNSAKTVYEVMGKMGAKNIMPQYTPNTSTISGITMTLTEDGGYILNGTSTGYATFVLANDNILKQIFKTDSYILSTKDEIANGIVVRISNPTDDPIVRLASNTERNVKFTINSLDVFDAATNYNITVVPNTVLDNVTVYPMFRLADDQDDTWRPYAMTNKELTDNVITNKELIDNKVSYEYQGKMGTKNLLPYPYFRSHLETDGLTYNTNLDGSILVDGTSTAYSFMILKREYSFLPHGDYIFSFDGNIPNTMFMGLGITDPSTMNFTSKVSLSASQKEQRFTIDNTWDNYLLEIRLVINTPNASIDNVVVYPMIRLAENTDNTWQSYTMTNQQLTNTAKAVTFVTPEQFGATGNGVSDDTQAIQQALNTNKTVHLGSKQYVISSSLVLNKNQVLIGEGCKSVIYVKGLSTNAITIPSTSYRCEIRNLLITSNTNEGNNGIYIATYEPNDGITDSSNIINNVTVKGLQGSGIYIEGENRNCSLTNIHVLGCQGHGVYVSGTDNSLNNIEIGGCAKHGIYLGQNNRLYSAKAFLCGTDTSDEYYALYLANKYNNVCCYDLQQTKYNGIYVGGNGNNISFASDGVGYHNTDYDAHISVIVLGNGASANRIIGTVTQGTLGGMFNHLITTKGFTCQNNYIDITYNTQISCPMDVYKVNGILSPDNYYYVNTENKNLNWKGIDINPNQFKAIYKDTADIIKNKETTTGTVTIDDLYNPIPSGWGVDISCNEVKNLIQNTAHPYFYFDIKMHTNFPVVKDYYLMPVAFAKDAQDNVSPYPRCTTILGGVSSDGLYREIKCIAAKSIDSHILTDLRFCIHNMESEETVVLPDDVEITIDSLEVGYYSDELEGLSQFTEFTQAELQAMW